MTSVEPKKTGRAVVIGASVAGLIAARALTDSFERVTLLERDVLPDGPGLRRGVPQARHLHGFLARGAAALEALFPGFAEEMVAEGAIRDDIQSGTHWYIDGHLLKPEPSGLLGIASSRALLEWVLRRRTLALPGVELLDGIDVLEVVAASDHRRVTGVRVRPRTRGPERDVLAADLVVDASGRGSRAPSWLKQWGYEPPPESRVSVDTTYVTWSYRRGPQHPERPSGRFAGAFPGSPRSAFLLAQEDDRLILTTAGIFGEQPPMDDDGLLRFAESLPAREFAEFLRTAERVGEPVKMRYRASVRRYYEKLGDFPAGYLVVGDAVCSSNPVYGHGMTVAAMEGVILRELLEDGPEDLAKRFFAAVAKPIGTAWTLSSGSDRRFPESGIAPKLPDRLLDRYLVRLYRAAAKDAVVAQAFIRVLNLMDTPDRLLRPAVVRRVFRRRS